MHAMRQICGRFLARLPISVSQHSRLVAVWVLPLPPVPVQPSVLEISCEKVPHDLATCGVFSTWVVVEKQRLCDDIDGPSESPLVGGRNMTVKWNSLTTNVGYQSPSLGDQDGYRAPIDFGVFAGYGKIHD